MAIRGQERAGYGAAGSASAVCWPGLQQGITGALAGLESGWGTAWEGEGEGGREEGGRARPALPFGDKHHGEN